MAKYRLNKTELKKQKDALKRFQRYLPMLQLKKQQLQMERYQIVLKIHSTKDRRNKLIDEFQSWVAVVGEDRGICDLIKMEGIEIETINVAGVTIPVLNHVSFESVDYDLFFKPLWVDAAIERIQSLMVTNEELKVLSQQYEIVSKELRTTTQRVNLFEKVKIPETEERIRRIQVFLGDQETAAVVRGKIAKNKLNLCQAFT